MFLRDNVEIAFPQETFLSSEAHVNDLNVFRAAALFLLCFHATAIGHSFDKKEHDLSYTQHGSLIGVCSVEVTGNHESIQIVSVHATNDAAKRKAFFFNLRLYLDKHMLTLACIYVLNAQQCFRPPQSNSSLSELTHLLQDFDLGDASDAFKLPFPGYTHWQESCHACLDRIYNQIWWFYVPSQRRASGTPQRRTAD